MELALQARQSQNRVRLGARAGPGSGVTPRIPSSIIGTNPGEMRDL